MIKFDHMSLPVANPESSRDWYVANLGFEVEFEVPERRTIAIRDDADFTIFLYLAPGPLGDIRPAFTLQVDDVDAKYATLSARNVEFKEAPADLVWGYGAELYDPDGYHLQLWDRGLHEEEQRERKQLGRDQKAPAESHALYTFDGTLTRRSARTTPSVSS